MRDPPGKGVLRPDDRVTAIKDQQRRAGQLIRAVRGCRAISRSRFFASALILTAVGARRCWRHRSDVKPMPTVVSATGVPSSSHETTGEEFSGLLWLRHLPDTKRGKHGN